jgi:NADH-quinone oxidoreductase subunit L
MLNLVWLIPALPLAGFLLNTLLGRKLGEPKSGILATLMTAASFVVTVGVYFDLLSRTSEERHSVYTLFTWLPVGSLKVDMALLADPLSITMALFITGIGSLIHLYAIGYMHGDPKFPKFFMYLNLFVFSMLMLVLGENLLVTFLGWEGVGACSYFLISFWHTRDSAATAGKKAFVTNRVGDWGMMTAMFLAFSSVGTLSYSGINAAASGHTLAAVTATGIAMMLFVGACGKSAQLPLYLWLPDAMEGPTPVSALIHAATMVTSGVFLLTRMSPVLHAAYPWSGTVIATVGALTALFAATVAVAQTDIKKVLAYSTVSQLGFMFLAIGSGAYVAAIFHMITHAFFKALLFLGSGSVIHGMHHEQDMRKMGALRKVMPITGFTFIIGWLAIAGVPPFAGFWSKDEILLFAFANNRFLWAIGVVTALLTAYYMTRQVIMVFYGEARWNDHAEEHGAHGDHTPHESPWTMTTPLVVLAGLAVVGGALQLPFTHSTKFLEHWLEPIIHHSERDIAGTWADNNKWLLLVFAILVAATGIAASIAVYAKGKAQPIEPQILADGWRYDSTVSALMGGPGRKAFDGIAAFDAKIVDGAVNGVGHEVRSLSGLLRKAQTGLVRSYAVIIGFGAVAMLAWFLLRGVL